MDRGHQQVTEPEGDPAAVEYTIKSLKQAGLVAERPEGRNVYYRARPEGLEPLADWMSHYSAFWRDRFADLRALLEEIDP